MEYLKELILILMGGVLVNNYVLQKFLGICPFLGVSKKFSQAFGMGIAVTFVMLVATAVTHPLYTFLLKDKYEYLETILFILVIAALVQFVEIVLKKFIPALHASLGVYLPLITTNCAVLGVTLSNITEGYSFLESMADAALSVVDYFGGKCAYVNAMMNMSVDCDCCAVAEDPCIPDIGILAGRDIVAIEKASLDLIAKAPFYKEALPPKWKCDPDETKHIFERLHGKNPYAVVNALEEMGMGVQEYTLREIN